MSGTIFECGYGAIVNEDVQVLEACLSELCEQKGIIHVLEIGMHAGATARGIKAFAEARGCQIWYIGIDPDTSGRCVAWDGATVLIGDSAELFHKVPNGLDLVWVDGCHCMNHVILDLIHYAPKVRPQGFMCFHDINPEGAGQFHQYHGPDIPEFGLGTLQAFEALRWPWDPWVEFLRKWPEDKADCGTVAFRKGEPA